jgi:site-specific recombinase XerD
MLKPVKITPIEETKPLTLEEGLEIFQNEYMPARGYATKTRVDYTRDLQSLISFLHGRNAMTWEEVTLRDLNAFLADLDRKGIKPASRNRKADVFKTFFKFLRQLGAIRENTAAALIPPGVPEREKRFLNEEEFQALLAQVNNTRDRAIIVTFLQTGTRLSELSGLTIYDVELPRRITRNPEDVGFIRIKRKGGKEVSVPLNWKACKALQTHIKEQEARSKDQDQSTALFQNKFGGPLSARAIEQLVKKYLDKAKIKNASVHTLRHTMATHYVAKGGDLRSVQAMLGHESLTTTEQYVTLAKKAQRKMVQDLAL